MRISRDKLIKARDSWLKRAHNVELYDYQKEVSDAILDAVFFGKYHELYVEFSRQSGKTTCIVHTVEFIIYVYKFLMGKGVRIGIFAPQKEQAKTDFDRLKDAFYELKMAGIEIDFTEANATTLKPHTPVNEETPMATLNMGQGNEVYAFPVSKTSHPESKTLDLIIFEEAQD